MKKFLLLALAFSLNAFAAEVTVVDANISQVDVFNAYVDTSFKMDLASGQGFAIVNVMEDRRDGLPGYYDQWGRWYPSRNSLPRLAWTQKVKIDNLMIDGDAVIYRGTEGAVTCGKMTESRILKKPVLKLNGNCKLFGRITGDWRQSRVVVTLKTK